MYIIKNNSSIILNNGDNDEVIFSFNEYKDILKNLSTEKYDFFKIIHEKYSIKNNCTLCKDDYIVYKVSPCFITV